MESDDLGGMLGNLQRAQQLLALRRYADAERYLRQALTGDPANPHILHLLAVALLQQGNRRQEALETIERAIAAEPNAAELFALKAIVLADQHRGREALAAAEEAVRLDPYSDQAFAAQAQAYLSMEKWADAEQAARRALALDPHSSLAANQLAATLRLQGRTAENAEQIATMLARDPEDPDTHASAGWNCLQQGRRADAERHFAEALRREPDNEYARRGMIEAFKSRSPLYRGYLKWCFFMTRLSPGVRWALVIGLLVVVNAANRLFTGPYAPVGYVVVALYLLVVLWAHVARGVGNFMLLWDRHARHALLPREKIEAWAVGGAVFGGGALLIGGLAAALPDVVDIGIMVLAAAFPLAHTFTNDSGPGPWVFGTCALVCLLAALAILATVLMPIGPLLHLSELLFFCGLVLAMLSTWLAGVPALRR